MLKNKRSVMLNESRLYSFIDNQNGFTFSFLEGQKLMADLITIHNLGPVALDYYRKSVLTSMQMLNFLKPGENLGFYIDSEHPYFRFKIEISNSGTMRTLLLPEEFSEFPEKITGVCRVSKLFSNNKMPYTSITKVHQEKHEELTNKILRESYQTNSEVLTSEFVDQTLMVTKLPPVEIKKEVLEDIGLKEYILRQTKFLRSVFKQEFNDVKSIVEYFEDRGFLYLGSKEIKFFCPCTKERMLQNISTLHRQDIEEIFHEKDTIDVRCDYCNTNYHIKKSDFTSN